MKKSNLYNRLLEVYYVYVKTAFTDQCVYESDRFGCGSVMVWAGICHDGHTQLTIVQGTLNAVKYRDNILDSIALSFLQQRNFDHVFQHDNARCHVARVCRDFLNQNHFRVLPWQALSPDLSPIEHLWVELGRRVRHRQIHRKHYRSCVTHLCTSGDNIPQAFIQLLISSMRRRCEAVVTARGCHTHHCLMWYAHMNLNYTIFVDFLDKSKLTPFEFDKCYSEP